MLLIGGGLQAWSMSRGINLRLSELREVVARNAAGDLREPVHVDFKQWRWTLTPSAVDLLCRNIERTLDDNYKGVEKTAARELVHFLTRKKARR